MATATEIGTFLVMHTATNICCIIMLQILTHPDFSTPSSSPLIFTKRDAYYKHRRFRKNEFVDIYAYQEALILA